MTATRRRGADDARDVTSPTTGDWELVIGLEVHAELATATKMFCGAPNQFGGEPNTNIDPVTLGLPGSLPVLNERAVELGIRVGLALHCDGAPRRPSPGRTTSTRTCRRTTRSASTTSRSTSTAGSSCPTAPASASSGPTSRRTPASRRHQGGDGRIHGAEYSLVDYNRAGVPLVEIVGRARPALAPRTPGPT